MPNTLVVGAEGVLYRPQVVVGAAEPIAEGIGLYKLFRGFLIHVVFDSRDMAQIETWLKVNGITDAVPHVRTDIDRDLTSVEFQWREIERIRSQGPIWMVVTAYLEIADNCIENGLHAITFNRPAALGSSMRRRPWGDRVDQIRQETLARVEAEIESEHDSEEW